MLYITKLRSILESFKQLVSILYNMKVMLQYANNFIQFESPIY